MDQRLTSLMRLSFSTTATRAILSAIVGFALLLGISTTSNAQAQPDQINQLIEKLNKKPDDSALREEIIKLANETRTPVSEAARRFFVQGNTIAKDAKDKAGLELALVAYKEAIKAAPWWPDPYYNLATVQELLGSFADARASLNWYIRTNPGEKEVRSAKDKVYAIEAKEQLNATNAQTAAAREEAARRAAAEQRRREEDAVISGRWNGVSNDGGTFSEVYLQRNSDGSITILGDKKPSWTITGYLSEGQSRAEWTFYTNACGEFWDMVPVAVSLDRRRFEVIVPNCTWSDKQRRFFYSVRDLTWTFTSR